jgi:hypothetical protein
MEGTGTRVHGINAGMEEIQIGARRAGGTQAAQQVGLISYIIEIRVGGRVRSILRAEGAVIIGVMGIRGRAGGRDISTSLPMGVHHRVVDQVGKVEKVYVEDRTR